MNNDILFQQYQGELPLHIHNAKNLKDTCRVLSKFKDQLGQYPPSPETAKGFLSQFATKKPRTFYRYTQMIKAFMKWYGEPVNDINIRIPKNLPPYTEDREIEQLLTAIRGKKTHKKIITRDLLLVQLDVETGMRRAELADLKVKDIHEDFLIVRNGKGNKDRMMPIKPAMGIRLRNFTEGKNPEDRVFNLKPACIGNKIRLYAKQAGLSGFHTHTMRHKFATDLLEKGVNVRVVQELMGHENLSTTQVYLSITEQSLRDAINIIPGEHRATLSAAEHDILRGPHQIKIRDVAGNLINAIVLPLTLHCFITELKPGYLTLDKEGFTVRVTNQGAIEVPGDIPVELRSHLLTGGFSEVLDKIGPWKQGVAEYLTKCRALLTIVRNNLEKTYRVSMPTGYREQHGFTLDFPTLICADAVEQVSGSDHFKDFLYKYEGLNLKFGALAIYIGAPNEDIKTFEDAHRKLRVQCAKLKQTRAIAEQKRDLNDMAMAISQPLQKFMAMDHLPGRCELCT